MHPDAPPSTRPCLALHGLGGGPYELQPLVDALRASGRRVEAPTLPGHEGPGPVMPASTWTDWAAAVEAAHDALAAEGAGPVDLVGFSTGGTLALHLATRRPVGRLVLIAPFLAIRYAPLIPLRPELYLGFLARILPDLRRRAPALCDRAGRDAIRRLDRFRTFSLPAACSALDLIARVKPLVPSITAPTLILQGRRDSVVDPSGALWLHRHLGSARKELVRLDRSDHLALLDLDRERALAAALDFLREDIPPGPGPIPGS